MRVIGNGKIIGMSDITRVGVCIGGSSHAVGIARVRMHLSAVRKQIAHIGNGKMHFLYRVISEHIAKHKAQFVLADRKRDGGNISDTLATPFGAPRKIATVHLKAAFGQSHTGNIVEFRPHRRSVRNVISIFFGRMDRANARSGVIVDRRAQTGKRHLAGAVGGVYGIFKRCQTFGQAVRKRGTVKTVIALLGVDAQHGPIGSGDRDPRGCNRAARLGRNGGKYYLMLTVSEIYRVIRTDRQQNRRRSIGIKRRLPA